MLLLVLICIHARFYVKVVICIGMSEVGSNP